MKEEFERKPGLNPASWKYGLGWVGGTALQKQARQTFVVNGSHAWQRIHTWVPDPVLGDMNYEHEFTNQSYVDLGNGVKFPTGWHNHVGWDDNYQAQSVNAGHNAFGGTFKDVRANRCDDPVPVPESVRQATFPVRVETQRLADGVFLLGGASHNSVAVEFKDFVAVVEAPLNERRSLAVIDAATIITHSKNVAFYMRDVLNYAPRTLQPDMVSLWPPTELAEGYFYEQVTENHVLSDGTRSMNIYYVQPLRHADGMLMAYLPKERMIIDADLFDTHEPPSPSQAAATTSLYNQVRALKLDVSQVVPIHGKPASWKDLLKVVGNTK